jgi:hypothetical protein
MINPTTELYQQIFADTPKTNAVIETLPNGHFEALHALSKLARELERSEAELSVFVKGIKQDKAAHDAMVSALHIVKRFLPYNTNDDAKQIVTMIDNVLVLEREAWSHTHE